MNAVEFQSAYGKAIKNFFNKCLEYEQLSLSNLQDIVMETTEKGFELKLKTDSHQFVQGCKIDEKSLKEIYFHMN